MNKPIPYQLKEDAILLLQQLIQKPSFSREESETGRIISNFLRDRAIPVYNVNNNIWATNKNFIPGKPTLFLNSHHDTVRPASGYTRDPFNPEIHEGKLFGLGSNDAGGCLVSLIAAFLYYYEETTVPFNIILAATGEEEISGSGGVQSLLSDMVFQSVTGYRTEGNDNWTGLVGEPTLLQMATAERGLMVLDCKAKGRAGHAARHEGENAIYKAMMDIEWIYIYRFEKTSELLGEVSMTVTSIDTPNKAHNVVPDSCNFIIDVRSNECYSQEEILNIIQNGCQSEVTPRSLRLKSTSISKDHPLVKAGASLGFTAYGSPTLSDKALLPFPALKIGPGDSARSHMADEFIYLEEIEKGIDAYIQLLDNFLFHQSDSSNNL